MPETVRLKLVEQPRQGLIDRLIRKREPAPDFIEHELNKMRTVDSCVDCIRRNFPSETDQFDIAEMIERILRNASRNLREFEGSRE